MEATLSTYRVTLPNVGKVTVRAYSPWYAAVQAHNRLVKTSEDARPCYRVAWVAACYGKRTLKAERVRVSNGFGG